MKTLARMLIFVALVGAGCVVLYLPFYGFMTTGELEVKRLMIHIIAGFALIFLGCEASDRLKERWGK